MYNFVIKGVALALLVIGLGACSDSDGASSTSSVSTSSLVLPEQLEVVTNETE
ncbi:hypothetical protein [Vibrio bivalvicida]|uniref:hypothetical protein n=1 Tax=Vibrio bivalvicida TaxID=1276888 RepID=UPI000A4F668A|nr:hypothetical protein [Vibrio bivalvicida]